MAAIRECQSEGRSTRKDGKESWMRQFEIAYAKSDLVQIGAAKKADEKHIADTFRPYLEARDWISINRGIEVGFTEDGDFGSYVHLREAF